MRRIALTVAILALTVAAGAQVLATGNVADQQPPSERSSLSVYFDQSDKPANLSYRRGAMTVKAQAQSVTMTQDEGRLTVKMRGGSLVTTAIREETRNFATAILWFDSNGHLIRYSIAE